MCRSQVDIHAPWGGVVPKLAQQAHEAAMQATMAACMQQAGVALCDLDAVAVTVGPGLSLCLKVNIVQPSQMFTGVTRWTPTVATAQWPHLVADAVLHQTLVLL